MSQTDEPSEINEVLSSIRRLVSDGTDEVTGPAPAEDGPHLVLTPSLRVEETDAEPVLEPLVLTQPEAWEDTPLDDRVLRLENAVSAAAGNWTPIVAAQAPNLASAEPLQLTTPVANVQEAPQPAELADTPELRALIAQVLREELKGEVGDKLSQNLRKMVRREIARALNDQSDS